MNLNNRKKYFFSTFHVITKRSTNVNLNNEGGGCVHDSELPENKTIQQTVRIYHNNEFLL